MTIFIVIFSIIVRIEIKNYPIFLLSAILPWRFFSDSVSRSSNSILGNTNLIKKIYFPREIFPLTEILCHLINFFLSLFLLIPFIFIFHITISAKIALLPLIMFLNFIFIYGLAMVFSSANVFFKDVGYITNFVLSIWFYASPVFYSSGMVPRKFYSLYMLNPMAIFIDLYRSAILNLDFPGVFNIIFLILISSLIFIFGIWFFIKNEKMMMKRI